MENSRPLLIRLIVGVRLTCDSEAGTCASDAAEYHQVDPSKLSAEAMAENDKGGEEEYRDIDAEFYDGDDFLTRAHLD